MLHCSRLPSALLAVRAEGSRRPLSAASQKASAVKKSIVGKKSAPAKRTGKGAAKYQYPKTGATWSGFGRAPGWIAGAANRDAFLVGKSGANATLAAVKLSVVKKKSIAKKPSAKKVAKTVAKKAVAAAEEIAPPAPAPAPASRCLGF